MPKKNVNKNANDPRAARSVRDIRNAMLELIAEKPFGKIQAEEIIELATVNFKTFYRYYSSKADVLEDISNDILKDLAAGLESLGSGNLMGGVAVFYNYINTREPAYKRLFNDEEYSDFFQELKDDFFSLPFFKAFCKDSAYEDMVPGYIGDAAVGMYRHWQMKPDDDSSKPTLQQLADQTARILMGGLKGINEGQERSSDLQMKKEQIESTT